MARNYYEILGVSQNASKKDIKKAYKNLAKKYHPDIPANRNTIYEDLFKEVNEAYSVLTDDTKRFIYDSRLKYRAGRTSAFTSYSRNYTRASQPFNRQSSPRYKSPGKRKKARKPGFTRKQKQKYSVYTILLGLAFVVFTYMFTDYMSKYEATIEYKKALSLIEHGNYLTAMYKLNGALRNNNEYFDAYYKRARVKQKYFDNYKGALHDYNKAIKYGSKEDLNAGVYYMRANCHLSLKNYDHALDDLQKGLAVNPEYDSAYLMSGEINAFVYHDYKKALVQYNKALELNSDLSEAYFGKGYCFLQLDNFYHAKVNFNRMIRLFPEEGRSYYFRGVSEIGLQDTLKACKDWEKAHSLGFEKAGDQLQAHCN